MKIQFRIKDCGLKILEPAILLVIGFMLGLVWFRSFVLQNYPKVLGEINPGANIIRIDKISPDQIIANIDSSLSTRVFLGKEIIFPDENGNFVITNFKAQYLSHEFVQANCAFAASKSGKKYYSSDHWRVEGLSAANLLCFQDEYNAKQYGFEKGK